METKDSKDEDQSKKAPRKAPKNIILCADGTGNKGGYSPDSNVYKVYKAIEKDLSKEEKKRFKVSEQIVFYDNGVGTNSNKYLRALSGGLGFGFEDNVCDLYKFLARNYEPGDRIYFFGFSRGASTVRACNGFISKCGLAKGKEKRNSELDELVKEAFEAYKVHETQPEIAEGLKESNGSYGAVPVYFMGIWDTVVALGFPKRTDVTGIVSKGLNKLSEKAEKLLDRYWPHSFYYYRLTGNVENAYQALAIDDERTAFWPFVWREQGREKGVVEQVWFVGMHSNVGGGYGRSGLASVPLYWMMLRAEKSGLVFEDSAVQKALDDSHVHGRMYDSRDGAAIIYRYHPREIEKLCKVEVSGEIKDRLNGEIKIHRSVIERINHRTANYAPGQLPGKFEVIEDDPGAKVESRNPGSHKDWADIRSEIDQWVSKRKQLYERMLTFLLGTVLVGLAAWYFVDVPEKREGFLGYIADILDYFVPGFLEYLVHFIVYQYPPIFIGALLLGCYYVNRRNRYRDETVKACEKLRHLVIHEND